MAHEQNIAIQTDKERAECLRQKHVGREIPESLYKLVAELLAWVYQLNNGYSKNQKTRRAKV